MRRALLLALVFGLPLVPVARAQEPATAQGPLEVGSEAPDFALEGATRFGILRDPVRLSDFRGKTVVLAFFFQVRTPG
ncbi:MAG: hypothetical protein ACE5HF_10940 [Gemmatimonadota bacterium]